MKNPIILIALFFTTLLSAGIPINGPYVGPTEQQIKRISKGVIVNQLRGQVGSNLLPLLDSIASEEDWGHIGYHGATQGYRIYQDIIRFTMEEVLNFYIREDFLFLRVPGDQDLNLDSVQEFYSYWGNNIDNFHDTRAKQLLSMNYGIYSNFDNTTSCSCCLFAKDESVSYVNYAAQLYPFYQKLGIDPKHLDKLFALANKFFNKKEGILMRISENSHVTDPKQEAYNFADKLTYPAQSGGYVYEYNLISDQFARIMSDRYVNRRVDISPQIRLLISNRFTLNPFSHLVIKRWDTYPKYTIDTYEYEMREYIRNLHFDYKKVDDYKNLLLKTW